MLYDHIVYVSASVASKLPDFIRPLTEPILKGKRNDSDNGNPSLPNHTCGQTTNSPNVEDAECLRPAVATATQILNSKSKRALGYHD